MNKSEYAQRVADIKERLYRTAFCYFGNAHDSLEAVDETVYKALVALPRLRESEFFGTWITRILINVCKDELRRKKRYTEVFDAESMTAEHFDGFPIRDALERLPTELREPLVLRYFTGLTLEQAAEALDIPRGTLSTRIRRAKELLRIALTEEDL